MCSDHARSAADAAKNYFPRNHTLFVMLNMLNSEQYYLKIGKASELKKRSERWLFRFLEILPGAISWLTLILMFLVSWQWPVVAAVFIILFDIYWFFKTFYFTFHLAHSFKILRNYQKKNWILELEKLPKEKYRLPIENWQDLYHLIILPMANEDYAILKSSFEALLHANYPKEKFIVVLATEGRYSEKVKEAVEKIKEEFSDKFFRFLITIHPADISGELAGKGANAAWAGKEAKRLIIDELKIPYERIIVSNFDIDTVILPEYFGCLSYHYLTASRPLQSSYQPIPLFTNNIWIAPALARIISFSSTFWQLIQQSRPERMSTFSSHSMPFQALVDIDFWQTNVVSEDSRIFWQCFLYYNGEWDVVPLFYSVQMDANVDKTFFKTMVNQYKQQRRWGYGAFDIAYAFFGFLKNKKISFWKKLSRGFFLFEGFYSWATASLLIFFLGWLPLVLGGSRFNLTLLSFNLPQITSYIMTAASFGIVIFAVLSFWFLPPRPPKYGKWRYLFFVLQWFLMPINLIVFGALPALEAQTRLMLGKYMGFWITPKYRK